MSRAEHGHYVTKAADALMIVAAYRRSDMQYQSAATLARTPDNHQQHIRDTITTIHVIVIQFKQAACAYSESKGSMPILAAHDHELISLCYRHGSQYPSRLRSPAMQQQRGMHLAAVCFQGQGTLTCSLYPCVVEAVVLQRYHACC